jgi:hypothetical protein
MASAFQPGIVAAAAWTAVEIRNARRFNVGCFASTIILLSVSPHGRRSDPDRFHSNANLAATRAHDFATWRLPDDSNSPHPSSLNSFRVA